MPIDIGQHNRGVGPERRACISDGLYNTSLLAEAIGNEWLSQPIWRDLGVINDYMFSLCERSGVLTYSTRISCSYHTYISTILPNTSAWSEGVKEDSAVLVWFRGHRGALFFRALSGKKLGVFCANNSCLPMRTHRILLLYFQLWNNTFICTVMAFV